MGLLGRWYVSKAKHEAEIASREREIISLRLALNSAITALAASVVVDTAKDELLNATAQALVGKYDGRRPN